MNREAPLQATTILALDTALGACSVAICRDDIRLASAHELRQSGHAEALMPMISTVCTKAGLTLKDIDIFAVTLGPGTFTGLRIGLAAARGLAQSLDCPMAGFSTLEVLAWGALAHLPTSSTAQNLVVVHDARRSEVYAQCFKILKNGLGLEATTAPLLLSLDVVADFIPAGDTWLAGSGARLALDLLPENTLAKILPDAPVNPDAIILAALTARKLAGVDQAGLPKGYHGLAPLTPIYLRAPDAKLPGGVSL